MDQTRRESRRKREARLSSEREEGARVLAAIAQSFGLGADGRVTSGSPRIELGAQVPEIAFLRDGSSVLYAVGPSIRTRPGSAII